MNERKMEFEIVPTETEVSKSSTRNLNDQICKVEYLMKPVFFLFVHNDSDTKYLDQMDKY